MPHDRARDGDRDGEAGADHDHDPDALVFALPPDSDRVSGGNIYNERLIGALRALIPVQTIGMDACRARIVRGAAGRYVIDSLCLREFLDLPARQPGQAFILIAHHLPSLEPDHDPQGEPVRVEQAALPRFDALVATSPFTASYLLARGYAATRILTVPPAPPALTAGTAAPVPRTYEPPLRALVVANLIPRKGVLPLLAALDDRLSADDDLVIDVIGRVDLDGDYARRCAARAERSRRLAPIVHLHGVVPPAEMPRHYQGANVFVSAARMETFGMALQEARAHGLPIVALDGGYVRHHFTDGDDGLLFSSCDDLAAGLVSLVRDPARARALFARAQLRRWQRGGQPTDQPTEDAGWAGAARRFLDQLAALAA